MKKTEEEIEAKAKELSEKHGKKVHPLVFVDPETDEQIIGYLQEPDRIAKIRAIDMGASMGAASAGEMLLSTSLVREESDPRFSSEDPQHDHIVVGAIMEAQNLVKRFVNQYKKK